MTCRACLMRPVPISGRAAVCAVCREAARAVERERMLARRCGATTQARLRAEERSEWREGRAS